MSYVTRAVIQPKPQNKNGIPLAFLRYVETMEYTHPAGSTITAAAESRNGCKFQFGFYAATGGRLTLGEPGQPNSLVVDIGKTITLTITGTGGSANTVSADFPATLIGHCEVPLHFVFISIYDDWRSYGAAIAVDNVEVANKAFGSAFGATDRIFVNGQKLEYNGTIFGVQIGCTSQEWESLQNLDICDDIPRAPFARFRAACEYGEVWEEWAKPQPLAPGALQPQFRWDDAYSLQWWQPLNGVTPIRQQNDDGVFRWQRPEGVRAVHLWLCGAGGGGVGGQYKLGPAVSGEAGGVRHFKVDCETLTLHVPDGGAGGGKYNKPAAETASPPTVADEIDGGTSAGAPGFEHPSNQLVPFQRIGVAKYARSFGLNVSHFPYLVGHIINDKRLVDEIRPRYTSPGAGGTNSMKLSEITAGKPGQPGVAVFHYQF